MLQSLGLEAGQRDQSLQALAALAANLAGTSIGMVCLIERDRILAPGAVGFESPVLDRADSFSTHALLEPHHELWVADARADDRFKNSRYVVGSPHVRFYAGVFLSVNGARVGALCVLDPHARAFDASLMDRLKLLARACETELAERNRTRAMRQALTASADALIDCSADGRVVSWSPGAERLFGFSEDEALGREVTLIIPEDQRQAHLEGMRRWRESGAARLGRRLELPAIRRDGSGLDVELWMSVSHENGQPRVHANIRDISERRALARETRLADDRARELQTQLHQVWRLNSLGEMAAALSHELNQPLTAATTYIQASQYALSKADLIGQSAGQTLDLAKAQLLRAGAIIRRMRGLLAHDTRDLQVERVSEMIDDLQNIFQMIENESGVVIAIDIDDRADEVRAERIQFQQAIINLVRNAVEAQAEQTDGRVLIVGAAPSSTRFELRVEDAGPGIEADRREAIFTAMKTTKASGMGLGLSVTRSIVEGHGGALSVQRSAMGGAAFIFDLMRVSGLEAA